jgi:hypothetical protein
MLHPDHCGWVFQFNLARFRPFVGSTPQLEGLGFPMDDNPVFLDADDSRVAGPSRGVFSCQNVRH